MSLGKERFEKRKAKRLEQAKQIWEDLGTIPVDDNGCIQESFLSFPERTHVEDIWHTIEEDFNISIAKDLMFKKTEK